jgi:hypothetical protein
MAEGDFTLDFSEVQKFAQALDKFPDTVGRLNQVTMQKIVSVVKDRIIVHTPVFLGNLRGSYYPQIYGEPLNLTGKVASDLIYGLPVDQGRPPGKMPPVDAIEHWVRRKLGVDGAEARQVAYIIARAIGRRGIKAVNMAQKAVNESEPVKVRLWVDMLNQVVIEFDRLAK